jgi:hypothetical protein
MNRSHRACERARSMAACISECLRERATVTETEPSRWIMISATKDIAVHESHRVDRCGRTHHHVYFGQTVVSGAAGEWSAVTLGLVEQFQVAHDDRNGRGRQRLHLR